MFLSTVSSLSLASSSSPILFPLQKFHPPQLLNICIFPLPHLNFLHQFLVISPLSLPFTFLIAILIIIICFSVTMVNNNFKLSFYGNYLDTPFIHSIPSSVSWHQVWLGKSSCTILKSTPNILNYKLVPTTNLIILKYL